MCKFNSHKNACFTGYSYDKIGKGKLMAHLALYRRYRPKTFKEIVGQEHIIQTLTNAIASGNISHAYLFTGPRGTGKTTTARLLAKSLNCQNRKGGDYEPCNKCSSCEEINTGKAVDLIEIDAASNRGIDEMRELKEGVGFLPVKLKYKVFIIDEAHQLTKEAANALLKTLEEPPTHAVFVLATTEAQKMIPTIASRCQRFSFRRLSIQEISHRLEYILRKEGIKFEQDALAAIAASANGCIRDAETLLDQAVSFGGSTALKKNLIEELLGLADKKTIFTFINYLFEKKTKEAIELLNEVIDKGTEAAEFLKLLLHYLRQILLLKVCPNLGESLLAEMTTEEGKELLKLAEKFSVEKIKVILERFEAAEQKMKYANIFQLPIELAVVDVCED